MRKCTKKERLVRTAENHRLAAERTKKMEEKYRSGKSILDEQCGFFKKLKCYQPNMFSLSNRIKKTKKYGRGFFSLYDVIVVGGGHAGTEAAAASAR